MIKNNIIYYIKGYKRIVNNSFVSCCAYSELRNFGVGRTKYPLRKALNTDEMKPRRNPIHAPVHKEPWLLFIIILILFLHIIWCWLIFGTFDLDLHPHNPLLLAK